MEDKHIVPKTWRQLIIVETEDFISKHKHIPVEIHIGFEMYDMLLRECNYETDFMPEYIAGIKVIKVKEFPKGIKFVSKIVMPSI